MKRFQNFICEYLFKGFNYIDEKMGWVEESSLFGSLEEVITRITEQLKKLG